jgi:hypothetical protein
MPDVGERLRDLFVGERIATLGIHDGGAICSAFHVDRAAETFENNGS